MLDPVTILTALAYAVARSSGKDSRTIAGKALDEASQALMGALGNSLYADIGKLRQAFLTITRPDNGNELDRAAARSALHASLFCLMEALGEPMEQPTGRVERWRQYVEERLPRRLREPRGVGEGVFTVGNREQLRAARQDCEKQLAEIEERFTPLAIDPQQMLLRPEDDYARKCSSEALAAIEEKHHELPEPAREIFRQQWFRYLCGSFQHEIQSNQPVANILSAISIAELRDETRHGFTETRELIVIESGKIQTAISKIVPPPSPPVDPFATVPPLGQFIERPEISEPLMEKLLSGSGTVGLTALEGMGGVGKTMVAIGLCHNPKTRESFPDGIVWLALGRESRTLFEKHAEKIAKDLNREGAAYQSLFQDKAVLVVVDDVWSLRDIEPFRLPPGRSRLLYTSRDKTIAGSLGAASQEVGVLDPAQARRFLARWSGCEAGLPEPAASGILSECKGLALGLAMIGAALKGKPGEDWADLLTDLKNARLKNIDRRPAGYGYETLHAAIAVSVDALDAEDKARYLRLAMLLEEMPAATPLLQALWGVDAREARRIAGRFADRSLARRDAEGILLHDFQLDYVRGENPQPAALALERAALLRSSHVVRPHPEQFASQMTGRLLGHADQPGIAEFLRELRENAPRPWLRPLRPALDPADGPAQRRLEGHEGPVRAVAVTADGKRAVSGSDDGTLMVWDLEGHQPPRTLEGHMGPVYAVAVTADGKCAISGSEDHTLMVWDLEGRDAPRKLEGHTGAVRAVALAAGGKRAVSGSHDHTLMVWDLEGHQPPRRLEGQTGPVRAVAVTGDGRRAVSDFDSHALMVWDLEGRESPRRLEGHKGVVLAVAVTADGKRAVSGSHDQTLMVWDLEGHQPPRRLEGHTDWVNAVAMTADGKRAVSGSIDRTLMVWDLEGHLPSRRREGHTDLVNAVAVTGDGKRVVSGSFDHTLMVWDPEGREPPRKLAGHTDYVRAVAVTADGKRAVSGAWGGTLIVWDLEGREAPRRLESHTNWVNAVAVTVDGKRAVSGSVGTKLMVWDLEGDQPPRRLAGHRDSVYAVAITADGKRAISGSRDHTLMVWDLESREPPRKLEGHTDSVRAVAVTADGRRAVSGSWDHTLIVWDLEQGTRLAAFTCDAPVSACGCGGGYVVAGDYRGNFHMLAFEE